VGSSVNISQDVQKQNKVNNLIFEHIIREPYANEEKLNWRYFYEPTYKLSEDEGFQIVNVAEKSYPQNFSEKIERILLNLYGIKSNYGAHYIIGSHYARALFLESDKYDEVLGIVSIIHELGYLIKEKENEYKLSAKGWQRIDECLCYNSDSKQAFVAMAFGTETNVIREGIKKGIIKAGYQPILIDEKEHNNQIVPEIFAEIKRSRFVVMDATKPNYGAYYEAGYALEKEKLVEKLEKRIKATVY